MESTAQTETLSNLLSQTYDKSTSHQSLAPRISIATAPLPGKRAARHDYELKNPVKISDVQRVLFDSCETLARIGKKLKDDGKLLKHMRDIHESFTTRKEDLKAHLKPASYTSSTKTLSTQTLKSSSSTLNLSPSSGTLTILQSNLYSLYIAAFTMSQLLSPVSPSSLGIEAPGWGFVSLSSKRKRLEEVYLEIERSWQALMMHLTLEIARDAHGGTRSVCEGLHKLAVATGAPDWEDLTLDDGRLLFARGEKYVLGLGVNKSYDLAWKAYLSAAQCGNASAMNMLGVMSETGMAGNVDMVGAMKWFSQAAKNDCPEALCNLGRIYETGSSVTQDFSLASTFYLRGAELGNPDAMTSLGWLLENGLGKEKDEGLAVQWYRLAANSGYARAMNSLGGCYYRGVGVDKDYGEAVIWYKKGAELGNAHAQNNLGICYEEGKGVLKDLVLAKTWYKAASDSKHPNATNNLGYMHLIEKNYTEALKLFYLAWALGSADAAYNIGHLYETGCEDNDGIVVEQNTELALRWYRDASEKDSTKAQIRLATLLTTLPNPRLHDAEIAITYLEKAVSTKSTDAMCLMGQFLQLGIGTGEEGEPDDAAAVELFSEGAKMGHAGCLYQLGGCYERGVGVERDFEKSMKIFEEAARLGHVEAITRLEFHSSLGNVSGYYEAGRLRMRSTSICSRGRSRTAFVE